MQRELSIADFWDHPLAGFSARHIRSEDDFKAMLAIHDACRVRDRIDPYSVCYQLPNLPIESYKRRLQHLTSSEDNLVVEKDGSMIAYAFMEAWGHEERLYLWRVWIIPRYRNLGIGTAMNRWGEARSRQLHGTDERKAMHLANASDGEADAATLLRNEGHAISFISPELAFDDFKHLPDEPRVNGIEFRPLAPADHRAVARALSEANLNPPGHEGRFAGTELEHRIDVEEKEWLDRVTDADPALSPVAWSREGVAGAYLCRAKEAVGEISQVAVCALWRGRGVARALSLRSLRGLRDRGCVTARLFTSKNPGEIEPAEGPYAMYRKFGFRPIAMHLRFRKPMARGLFNPPELMATPCSVKA